MGCSVDTSSELDLADVELIFWERQSWEVGGGRSRLTLWADGRSEIIVVPDAGLQPQALRPRDGWSMRHGSTGPYFIRTKVFPPHVTKAKLARAVEADIHMIETFKADYVDGSGTLVGIKIRGTLKKTVVPMFLDRHKDTINHKRFLAVAQILADFDTRAYDIGP